jgi:ketosteroid isomerase-like protein
MGDAWRDLFSMGYTISWEPTKVDVAQSGDLGYSQGTYAQRTGDSNGKTKKGKYVVVWKKEPGGWKAVAEIANSD